MLRSFIMGNQERLKGFLLLGFDYRLWFLELYVPPIVKILYNLYTIDFLHPDRVAHGN